MTSNQTRAIPDQATAPPPVCRIERAVWELRRTIGQYKTPTERGEAAVAAANAADMLERLLGRVTQLQALAKDAINDQ